MTNYVFAKPSDYVDGDSVAVKLLMFGNFNVNKAKLQKHRSSGNENEIIRNICD